MVVGTPLLLRNTVIAMVAGDVSLPVHPLSTMKWPSPSSVSKLVAKRVVVAAVDVVVAAVADFLQISSISSGKTISKQPVLKSFCP